jgi:hypothetical protein
VDTSEGNSTEELGENQKKVIEILKDWDLWWVNRESVVRKLVMWSVNWPTKVLVYV